MNEVQAIWCQSINGVIGRNNTLPWNLPKDMKRFVNCTTGKTVVMGRKTHESIGKPLPNRVNVVISKSCDVIPGCVVIRSTEEISNFVNPIIIGGSQLYNSTLHLINTLHVTIINKHVEGDAFAPNVDLTKFWCYSNTEHEENGMCFNFVTYKRK